MCLYPKLIRNPKYKVNQKNGGNVPAISDQRVTYVPIGCQKCMECRKQKRTQWQIRLSEDIKEHRNGHFVTLTFSNESYTQLYNIAADKYPKDESYDRGNRIATIATRRFLERWRKEYGQSIRHWLVTELGTTRYEHLHLHGILYTDHKDQISKIWQYGFVFIGNYVSEKTINYITKYILKADEKHPNYNPILLTSSGIGKRYTEQPEGNWLSNKFKETETNERYRTQQGTKLNLPIYYRNKIYTEEQREKLWIEMLNKQERYVKGERVAVDTEKGEAGIELLKQDTKNAAIHGAIAGYQKRIEAVNATIAEYTADEAVGAIDLPFSRRSWRWYWWRSGLNSHYGAP